MIKRVEAQLINTTNDKFRYIIGEIGTLIMQKGNSADFYYGLLGAKYLYTSVVEKITEKEVGDSIHYELKTMNSVYEFKLIKLIESNELPTD